MIPSRNLVDSQLVRPALSAKFFWLKSNKLVDSQIVLADKPDKLADSQAAEIQFLDDSLKNCCQPKTWISAQKNLRSPCFWLISQNKLAVSQNTRISARKLGR
jgi:outer membrane PBP1 activator LpoA protein